MRRVLVTGATGGLGRNAVLHLLAQGVKVRATGRNTAVGAALRISGAEFVRLDLATAEPHTLAEVTADCDAVWHCAALSAPWGPYEAFLQANVEVTRRLLGAAATSTVSRFVHISTPALYFDYQHRYDLQESYASAKPVNHYAATKAYAERVVQDVGALYPHLHTTILRPRAIFGPYDQVLVPRLLRLLTKRKGRLVLPRAGETVLDMTFVGNVVQAMQLATEKADLPSGEVFNITNGEPMPVRQVLESLFVEHLRQSLTIKALPYPVLQKAARLLETIALFTKKEPALTEYSLGALAFDMTLDISKARHLLGYTPAVSMQDAIAKTAAWLKKHP